MPRPGWSAFSPCGTFFASAASLSLQQETQPEAQQKCNSANVSLPRSRIRVWRCTGAANSAAGDEATAAAEGSLEFQRQFMGHSICQVVFVELPSGSSKSSKLLLVIGTEAGMIAAMDCMNGGALMFSLHLNVSAEAAAAEEDDETAAMAAAATAAGDGGGGAGGTAGKCCEEQTLREALLRRSWCKGIRQNASCLSSVGTPQEQQHAQAPLFLTCLTEQQQLVCWLVDTAAAAVPSAPLLSILTQGAAAAAGSSLALTASPGREHSAATGVFFMQQQLMLQRQVLLVARGDLLAPFFHIAELRGSAGEAAAKEKGEPLVLPTRSSCRDDKCGLQRVEPVQAEGAKRDRRRTSVSGGRLPSSLTSGEEASAAANAIMPNDAALSSLKRGALSTHIPAWEEGGLEVPLADRHP
ncbi:hypothetical protein cyc_03212 [Cyclospora cayetanensis]|uniref:Uncharacterized protein n=1 Tax=Cyclospora cayetanensis TaxID=88456 RepID=A0A1D3D7D3_9EIME|nr:hypothetical protein cyc_03212 [Cyclospora cayetanensis]